VFRFFSSNARFLVLSAIVFSALAAAILLALAPESYQKRVILAIEPTPGSLAAQLGLDSSQIKVPTQQQVVEITVAAVEEADLGGVEANAGSSEEGTPEVPVTLRARGAGDLERATPEVVEAVEAGFQDEYEGTFARAIERRLGELDLDARVGEGVVGEMERQAEALYAEGLQDAGVTARAEALEDQRAVALGDIFEARTEQASLEQARGDLPRLTGQLTDVSVLEESAPTETGSTAATIAFAVLLGLALALVATVARAAFRAVGREKK
jgi:hypothetical protein